MPHNKNVAMRPWHRARPWLILIAVVAAPLAFSAGTVALLDDAGGEGEPDPQVCNGCEPPPEDGCILEVCDGRDNDCDGLTDEGLQRTYYLDADGDGKGAGAAKKGCAAPIGYVYNKDDCNDNDASLWQWVRYYRDADADGYGNAAFSTDACSQPAGFVTNASDCNDLNAAVKPGAMKTCGIGDCTTSISACINGIEQPCVPGTPTSEVCDNRDNNCNGQIDELADLQCGVGACVRVVPACTNICWEEETQDGKPPRTVCEWGPNQCIPGTPKSETCNSIDDNCNGAVDDGALLTFYRDGDGDGYGKGSALGLGCSPPAGQAPNNQDCNDSDAAVKPGVMKTCGVGACTTSVPACIDGAEQPCKPGLPTAETCDRVDNDCNNQVDDPPPLHCGTGACARTAPVCAELCWLEETRDGKPPVERCEWGEYGVCIPGEPVSEICGNGIDEDCTGVVDDSMNPLAWRTFFADRDGDGHGASWESQRACSRPPGSSLATGDCDDAAADVGPGLSDVCDGQDNDCDGQVDEEAVCRAAVACGEPVGVTAGGRDQVPERQQ
ncbi:putative metal-binding motif-containing protein [Myxococcus sp. RHSTA-1-4]|uniref:putative metal-binding motif-containing protein n=1 Tax=Myxococcus sp. RHSTA-1-4 TaxID=2874601 RepID=UPI001CBE2BDD|nr:putative metal-binding motif-containing protein [Myxococcus sp. RHSTA-1-4]MBZ4416290.1 putative metal-binding motif-containing protein [Myxococcus sp. RHSTA-1-4]